MADYNPRRSPPPVPQSAPVFTQQQQQQQQQRQQQQLQQFQQQFPQQQPQFGQQYQQQQPQQPPPQQRPPPPGPPSRATQSLSAIEKLKEDEEKEREEREMEEKGEEISKAYRVIMTDPRYLRCVSRTAPKTFSVQKLKQQVDPSSIPIFGTFVKGYRSYRVEKHKDTMDLAHVAGNESSASLAPSLTNMDLNIKAEANKRHIGLAVGMLFSVVPVASVTPVGSASGSAASAAIAKGTSEGIEEGIKKGAQKAGEKSQLHKMDSDNYEAVVHKKYLMTKSFLLYIGGPTDTDELYTRWEPHRLILKKLYGASEEDDLPRLTPTDDQKRQLKEARKKQEEEGDGVYDLQAMGVSMLWLMWEMYECWDVVYFDYLARKSHWKTEEEYLHERNTKDREEDVEYLAQLTLASNPLIRRVNNHELERVVALMMRNLDGEQMMSQRLIFTTEMEAEKVPEAKTWYCTTIAEYFLKNHEVWGLEDPETLLVKAVVLLEQSQGDRPRPFSVTGLAKAAKKIGTSATKTLKATNKALNDTRDGYVNKKDNSAQVIHFVGGTEELIQNDDNVKDLIMAIQKTGAEGQATGTHVFEFGNSPCCVVLEKAGFRMVGEKGGIRFYSAN